MAVYENALQTIPSKSYKYRDLTMREVANVIHHYKDLKPVMDNYMFSNGNNKKVLSLTGTVPVSFKGNVYNIPICLWLLDTYPFNPPICFVKPTSSMMIKTGKHIDINGKIYLPYLHEWQHPESNLFKLIQVIIGIFGEEPPVYTRPTIQTAYPGFQASGPPNDDSSRAETLTRCLGEMIVRDLQPLSIVEDEGFQGFVRALDPSYELPSRKQMAETYMVNMFDECKGKVRESLQNAPSVVLTTDMWTTESTKVHMTVTSHVIQNWQLRELVLETHSSSGKPTADNISSELKRMSDEWGISEKVVAVLTDNSENMIAAVHKAGWRHYPCFAHTLNLVVKDSLKAAPEVVQVVKKSSTIVTFFYCNTNAMEKLMTVQKQLKVSEDKLIQSVDTYWKSVFYMLERLFEQNEAVTKALCLLKKRELCLDTEELSLINQTLDTLRPLVEVTQEVSSEKQGSASKVIPLLSLLHRAVAACEHQGSYLATQLAQQCQQRFKGIETIPGLAASTFLDVRFKQLGFRDKDNVEAVIKQLLTEMQNVESCPSLTVTNSISVSSSQAPAHASGSAASKKGILDDFDMHVLSDQHDQSAATDVLNEMYRYLEEKPIPRDRDPLLWWQKQEQNFPGLSKLAVKYLGIVATSVPAERIFSNAGELVNKKRSRLNVKFVNMLLFLNKNL